MKDTYWGGRPQDARQEEEFEVKMSIGDFSTQVSPNYGLVDFKNYESIPINVNTDKLERMIQNM